jgi:hypothetical protein
MTTTAIQMLMKDVTVLMDRRRHAIQVLREQRGLGFVMLELKPALTENGEYVREK